MPPVLGFSFLRSAKEKPAAAQAVPEEESRHPGDIDHANSSSASRDKNRDRAKKPSSHLKGDKSASAEPKASTSNSAKPRAKFSCLDDTVVPSSSRSKGKTKEKQTNHKKERASVQSTPSSSQSGSASSQVTRKGFKSMKSARPDEVFTNHESLPSVEKAYRHFVRAYPEYLKSTIIDDIRTQEYTHLDESDQVCLDYTGYGLFSPLQQRQNKSSASFGISYISANLPTHALYGGADEGTVEFDLKKRVLEFLNIQESEYVMVFTASRGAAFKLLAESYPFHLKKRLLTVYDYESEAVTWMEEAARKKGAEIMSAMFRWPSQRLWATDLKKKILEKKKKTETEKGLFVFPVQSRVTGAKYSYQWMSQAQESGWDILLDASALGPKIMGSLGLSVFRPDFIVSSFFKVYGLDPTGFGCLLIKRSAIQGLHSSSAARGVGMVRLVSTPIQDEGLQDDEGTTFQNNSQVLHIHESNAKDMSRQQHVVEDTDGSIHRSFSGPFVQAYRTDHHESTYNEGDTRALSANFDEFHSDDLDRPSSIGTSLHLSASTSNACPFKLEPKRHTARALGQIVEDNMPDKYKHHTKEESEPSESETTHNRLFTVDSQDSEWVGSRSMASISQEDSEASSFRDSEAFSQQERLFSRENLSSSGYEMGSREDHSFLYSEDTSSGYDEEDGGSFTNEGFPDVSVIERKEPEVVCIGLDHADKLGLSRTNSRLRFLINWLVGSMLKLHHPGYPDSYQLVQMYGPKVSYERGPSIAFNLFDWKGNLIQPILVQKLADRSNISLGVATLHHIRLPENLVNSSTTNKSANDCTPTVEGHLEGGGKSPSIKAMMVALGFISSFVDVYKFWAFLAKFLDADFVSKEVWHYRALNQQTVVLGVQSSLASPLH